MYHNIKNKCFVVLKELFTYNLSLEALGLYMSLLGNDDFKFETAELIKTQPFRELLINGWVTVWPEGIIVTDTAFEFELHK